MNENEIKALEALARAYEAAPSYLLNGKNKRQFERLLIEAIDALDIVEYSRSKTTFLSTIQGTAPFARKLSILSLAEERHLTQREGHVLRYLANGDSTTYIARALGISVTTARTHTYSIYRKLGVHSRSELITLLNDYEMDDLSNW